MAIPRKLTANFVATEVDDEVLIVDLDGGLLFSLDGTARAIWHEIDGTASVEQIAARLTGGYEIGGVDVARDVAEFVRDLEAAKIVDLG